MSAEAKFVLGIREMKHGTRWRWWVVREGDEDKGHPAWLDDGWANTRRGCRREARQSLRRMRREKFPREFREVVTL